MKAVPCSIIDFFNEIGFYRKICVYILCYCNLLSFGHNLHNKY